MRTDEIKNVKPLLQQHNVSGSLSEPQTELQRERLIFQKGWCSAFNTWWKHKDENLDFRKMETKLGEAMEAEWTEHLSNYR